MSPRGNPHPQKGESQRIWEGNSAVAKKKVLDLSLNHTTEGKNNINTQKGDG